MFSPTETKILQILGAKRMSIAAIGERYYTKKTLDGNNNLSNAIRRIKRKCDLYDLLWTIESVGMGRHGKTVWKSKRRIDASKRGGNERNKT